MGDLYIFGVKVLGLPRNEPELPPQPDYYFATEDDFINSGVRFKEGMYVEVDGVLYDVVPKGTGKNFDTIYDNYECLSLTYKGGI